MRRQRILIIDDMEQKKASIEAFLNREFPVEVTWAQYINSAYSAVTQEWDLILLDMTFSATSGIGKKIEKEGLAGVEILQFIVARGLATPVIVITQHDTFERGPHQSPHTIQSLDSQLLKAFGAVHRGVIRYDAVKDDWQRELKIKAAEVFNARKN